MTHDEDAFEDSLPSQTLLESTASQDRQLSQDFFEPTSSSDDILPPHSPASPLSASSAGDGQALDAWGSTIPLSSLEDDAPAIGSCHPSSSFFYQHKVSTVIHTLADAVHALLGGQRSFKWMSMLELMTKKKELTLTQTNLMGCMDTLVTGLRTDHGLVSFKLSQCRMELSELEQLLQALADCPTLTALGFSYCELNDDAMGSIATLISHHRGLSKLGLSLNSIGPAGIGYLIKALELPLPQSWTSLQPAVLDVLNLDLNHIGNIGAKLVADSLSLGTLPLQTLNLAFNMIDAEGAGYLATALSAPACQLLALDVSGNAIGDNGLNQLAAALLTNEDSPLVSLSMSHCGLSGTGVAEFADTFAKIDGQKRSIHIDISAHPLGSTVAIKKIAELLQNSSCCIASLNLSHTELTDADLAMLAQTLTYNTSLHHLDLSVNAISPDAIRAFEAAIELNATLQTLKLSEGHTTTEKMQQVLVRNRENYLNKDSNLAGLLYTALFPVPNDEALAASSLSEKCSEEERTPKRQRR